MAGHVPTEERIPDVYLRDLRGHVTVLVSRATGAAGAKANASSSIEGLSANGRYVLFSSVATNLSPADTESTRDLYVRDLVTDTTTLASRATGAGGAKANAAAERASISFGGHLVSFESRATNLAPADSDAVSDVSVRDLSTNTTTLASRSWNGAKANDYSAVPAGLTPAFTGTNSSTAWVYPRSPAAGTRVSPGSTVTLQLRTGPVL